MTFFANSGIAWPRLDQQTQEAGEKSLDAAARLFKVLAAIEGKRFFIGSDDLDVCASELDRASSIYTEIAEGASNEYVKGLSPSEIEFAALPLQRSYRNDPYFELFLDHGKISIKDLYRELAQRASRLSSAVKIFNPNKEPLDLAGSAFQMMQLWDSMTTLARVIATLGRRQPKAQ